MKSITWLNHNEIIGFNAASLAPVANYSRKGRAMAFTGPGIACDWLDIEGPLHDVWPPPVIASCSAICRSSSSNRPSILACVRRGASRSGRLGAGRNRPDPSPGLWTVHSDTAARRRRPLLAAFLPRAFRRPVEADVRQAYVAKVEERLKAGDCFETAMRGPIEPRSARPIFCITSSRPAELDDHALACRLSYFFWNSLPDERSSQLADAGKLREPRRAARRKSSDCSRIPSRSASSKTFSANG